VTVHKALPVWPARATRLALLAIALILVVPIAVSGLLDAGDAAFYKHWIVNLALVAAAVATALRAVLVRAERLAWTLLATALGSYATGQIYWAFWLEQRPEPPFPSVCDALWLAIYPLGCAALVMLARRRVPGRPEFLLDGLVGGAALAALAEALVFGSIFGGTSGLPPLSRTIALAYPLGDLVLVATIAAVFALTAWHPGSFWLLVGGGFALAAVADTVYTTMLAEGVVSTTIALNGLWTLGLVAIGLAAWARPLQHVERETGWRVLLVPAVGGTVALTMLVFGAVARVNILAVGLSAIAIVASIGRAFFTFSDLKSLAQSQREAVTDYLTGLGNRRLLMRDLDEAFAIGRPLWLGVLDLDGFKAYNDRFGHTEGDLMLERLGRRLAAATHGHGGAYRIGGDEFCVLISERGDPAAVVEAATSALEESGQDFSVVCSGGVVQIPREATDASTALRIADSRMYAHKNSRPAAAKHQAAEVALGIIAEAQPNLGRHVDDVSSLAVTLGRELGLGTAELDDLARAADLHDVGKVAIPSSILDKAGPLDEEEWQWMRRHTLIGERMLAQAPSLRNVAQIVRATHERYDGTGYPDGLAAQQIPLAARIVAVCDAFDAMVSDRVYRPALDYHEAIRELERHAGTQFDPVVVAAFFAVQRARRAAA
jgi:diguanylate cyclase (GGDEF)-like protein